MLAVIAVIIFIVGFILHLAHNDKYLWDCIFLGLAALAANFVWGVYPWRRGGPSA